MSIAEGDLHAFVDGQLPAEERRRVERALAADPEAAARAARWAASRDALRARLAPAMREAVPLRLTLDRIQPRAARGLGWRIAATLGFGAGLALGLSVAGALWLAVAR